MAGEETKQILDSDMLSVLKPEERARAAGLGDWGDRLRKGVSAAERAGV